MLNYLLRRVLYTLPIMLGVALLCFALVHIAPGDPLVSILPPDASAELQAQMRELYGFNQPLPEQFFRWVWRALQGDLGQSIATSRPVTTEVLTAVVNTLRLAVVATLIGFFLGCLFGFVAGYFRNSFMDRLCSMLSVLGVSVPHYWLGMVLAMPRTAACTSPGIVTPSAAATARHSATMSAITCVTPGTCTSGP